MFCCERKRNHPLAGPRSFSADGVNGACRPWSSIRGEAEAEQGGQCLWGWGAEEVERPTAPIVVTSRGALRSPCGTGPPSRGNAAARPMDGPLRKLTM